MLSYLVFPGKFPKLLKLNKAINQSNNHLHRHVLDPIQDVD